MEGTTSGACMHQNTQLPYLLDGMRHLQLQSYIDIELELESHGSSADRSWTRPAILKLTSPSWHSYELR